MKTSSHLCSAIIILTILTSCTTAQKLHNCGDHDQVIEKLYNRAVRGSLNQSDLDIFQQALNVKIDKEREFLEKKMASKHFESWQRGFTRLDYISALQNQLSTFEQIDYNQIDLIDIDKWDTEFMDTLGTYHYNNFTAYQDMYFEGGNKNSLIKAYEELGKLAYFDTRGIDVDSMMNLYAEIGKRNIELVFKNKSPHEYKLQVLKDNIEPEDTRWSNFGTCNSPDFTAYIYLENLETYKKKSSKEKDYISNVRDPRGVARIETAVVNNVKLKYIVKATVSVDIIWNKANESVATKTFEEEVYVNEYFNNLVTGNQAVLPSIVVLSPETDFTDAYYDDLFQEALERIGPYIEHYLRSF